jgi:transcriptional regulator with XRE-family HTH domain
VVTLLGERLLKLRKEAKMTQVGLSSKLGIARTTYSGYELGTSEPDNETLERIADYYGVTTDYLLGREPKEKIHKEETEMERGIRETKERMIKMIDEYKITTEEEAKILEKYHNRLFKE